MGRPPAEGAHVAYCACVWRSTQGTMPSWGPAFPAHGLLPVPWVMRRGTSFGELRLDRRTRRPKTPGQAPMTAELAYAGLLVGSLTPDAGDDP